MIIRPQGMDDTIVARATPPGEGAIAVLRLSGPEARRVSAELSPTGKPRTSHRLRVADLVDAAGEVLDQAMLVEMHAPHSYTGEDVVELHVHGGRAVQASIQQRCIELGARLAQPGEFTLRAFLNGRLTLDQAEAVGDLVASSNYQQQAIAQRHLAGGLSKPLSQWIERLEGILAAWRAAIDYPEQAGDRGMTPGHQRALFDVECNLQQLIEKSAVSMLEGCKVVLAGCPNAGKSTLLNRWVGERRVLVDREAGTTRDPVEVPWHHGARRVILCDTAGLRDDAEGVEAAGIEMSRERIADADRVVWLLDPDRAVWPPSDMACVVIGSKADVASPQRRASLEAEGDRRNHPIAQWVSGKSGEGMAELAHRVLGEQLTPQDVSVVRERHLEQLRRAHSALGRLRAPALTLDLMSFELEEAIGALGAILGRDVDLSVLDRIFSDFCLGK